MIFTNIQFDDLDKVLTHVFAQLGGKGDASASNEIIEEHAWVMIGVINVAAILDHGRSRGLKECEKVAAEKARAPRKAILTEDPHRHLHLPGPIPPPADTRGPDTG